jgi:hypothetical protein
MINYIALAGGIGVTFWVYSRAGRLAGLGVTALWSVATAYFLMAPVRSLRVSNLDDLAALALFGVAGLVLAKTGSNASEPFRGEPDRPPVERVHLPAVLASVMSSRGHGERLRQRKIEVTVSAMTPLECSNTDLARVLSQLLEAAQLEPQLRRISFHAIRCSGQDLLFMDSHRVWPLPNEQAIIIGKRREHCWPADFPGLPSYIEAAWFDNGFGRLYQVSIKREPASPHG